MTDAIKDEWIEAGLAAAMKPRVHVGNRECDKAREVSIILAAVAPLIRAEDRAEIERLRDLFRLDGKQHAAHIKALTEAHEKRITKYADAIAALRAELAQARAQAMEEAAKERVRHKKRGSTYRVIGEAELQTSEPLPEGETVVVYQCETDGKLWARPDWEFHDGRFEALASPAKGESQ